MALIRYVIARPELAYDTVRRRPATIFTCIEQLLLLLLFASSGSRGKKHRVGHGRTHRARNFGGS